MSRSAIFCRKQGLHEMKILRREELNQGNELMAKIKAQWDHIDEKFRQEEEVGLSTK